MRFGAEFLFLRPEGNTLWTGWIESRKLRSCGRHKPKSCLVVKALRPGVLDPRPARSSNPVRRFFSILGRASSPGAADDDPSGIVTYSIAGAQLGTSLLWTALLTFPMMCAVQMMCARVRHGYGRRARRRAAKEIPQAGPRSSWAPPFSSPTRSTSAPIFPGMADVTQLLSGHQRAASSSSSLAWRSSSRPSASATAAWLRSSSGWRSFLFAYVITAFLVASRLGPGLPRHFRPLLAEEPRTMGHARGDPRHDHQSLPLFLAGLPGDRGRKGQGSPHRGQPPRRHRTRTCATAKSMSGWAASSPISSCISSS